MYKMLIIGGSGSGKTNAVLNLINEQDSDNPIEKIYLYAKDLNEPKYQFLIKRREDAGIKNLRNPKAFIEHSNTMHDIYNSIDDYNPTRKKKILIVFDDMVADIMANKKFQAIIKELFIRCRKLNTSLVFITQSYFSVPKEIRLNSTHYLMMKIHNKRELQQIAINHSADIDYKNFMKIYRKCTSEPYSFLTIDTKIFLILRFRKIFTSIIKMTLTVELKIIDDKIKANQAQYDLDREAAKISALSSKEMDKYEYLTGEDLGYKPGVVEQAKFEYSLLGKVFNKGLEKEDKKEGLLKRLKNIEGRNGEQLETTKDQGKKQLQILTSKTDIRVHLQNVYFKDRLGFESKKFLMTLKNKIKRLIIQTLSALAQVSNITIILPSCLGLRSFAESIYNGNLSLKAAKIKQNI